MVASSMTETARHPDLFPQDMETQDFPPFDDESAPEFEAARLRELLEWMERESGLVPEEIKREVDALYWNDDSS